jgi:hypothetical protein
MKEKEIKILWGLSGGRCAMCNSQIIRQAADGNWYHTGKQAHAVGRVLDSPRGDSPLSAEERDLAANRILLCGNCHDEIDTNIAAWPVETLRRHKVEHEERIRAAGERIQFSELAGTIEVVAVDGDEATGADIGAPTRIQPGTRIRVDTERVDRTTGVKIRPPGGS